MRVLRYGAPNRAGRPRDRGLIFPSLRVLLRPPAVPDTGMTDTAQHEGPDAPNTRELQNAFYAAGLAAIIVAVIYFGQPILMPAALAILLAFALAPLLAWLRSLGLGRVPSVIFTVLFAIV